MFQGNAVEMGGGFYEDQQRCMAEFMKWLKQHLLKYPKKEFPPDRIGPINYPPPDVIVESIYELVSVNVREADVLLMNMKLAHGMSYYRGLYSKAASRVGLSKEAKAGQSARARVGISQQQVQDILTVTSAVMGKSVRR